MQLKSITDYRTTMRENYSIGKSKDDVKKLNISKQEFLSQLHNPRDNIMPSITKKRICMDCLTTMEGQFN